MTMHYQDRITSDSSMKLLFDFSYASMAVQAGIPLYTVGKLLVACQGVNDVALCASGG